MKILITERQLKLILEDDSDDRSIEDIQRELVYVHKKNIGPYGPKKDGVDGIMGPMTRRAYQNVFGKPYSGPTFSSDSSDVIDKSVKNFHRIPMGNNNYRSAEPTADALKVIILKYGIKNVVRFNGDGGDSDGLSIKQEKEICEQNDCKFYKLSSTKDQSVVNELLNKGNTLIHCHHGADRTGGNVGGWLYSKGWDTKKIWDYTTQYNGWEKMIKNSPDKFVREGYLKQAQKFGVENLEHAISLMSGKGKTISKTNIGGSNIIIGDSQVPFIARNSKKVKMLSSSGGEGSLWKGGMGLSWLKNAVDKFSISENINSVVICIGTNGGFSMSDNVSGLFKSLRNKFPNANFYAVQGSWGWGGNKNINEDKVKSYYGLFENQGAILIEPPIGNVKDPHGNLPIYKIIGSKIDSLIA